MKQVIILHGIGGNPELNWYPYLADKLKQRGFIVDIPRLPNPDKPDIEKTYRLITSTYEINDDTILVGHSSGATLALGLLQKLPSKILITQVILIAGFIDTNLTPELFNYINRSDYEFLFPKRWDWLKIKQAARKFTVMHSRDDPFVPVRHAYTLKKELETQLILFPESKHFSITSGGPKFKKFPQLLRLLLA